MSKGMNMFVGLGIVSKQDINKDIEYYLMILFIVLKQRKSLQPVRVLIVVLLKLVKPRMD